MRLTRLSLALAAMLEVAACSEQRPTPPAMSGGLPAKLCKVLEKVVPEVRQLSPVGAQAQLVMAIAAAFDNSPEALAQVSAEIDAIASAGCAAERDSLLAVLKMKSLQEAVR